MLLWKKLREKIHIHRHANIEKEGKSGDRCEGIRFQNYIQN